MDIGHSDRWTQRVFYRQLRLLDQKGFTRTVRVPGKQTGSLIRCVELIREYNDNDNFSSSNATDPAAKIEDVDSDADIEDEDEIDPRLSQIEKQEELDLSLPNNAGQVSPAADTVLVAKDALLEWSLALALCEAGDKGLSGPQLSSRIGHSWSRPLDEQLKKICPAIEHATQPEMYGTLSVGPAVQEMLGRSKHFRYYMLEYTDPAAFDRVSRLAGQLPDILPDLRLITTTPTGNSGGLVTQQYTGTSAVMPAPAARKRGRPRKIPKLESQIVSIQHGDTVEMLPTTNNDLVSPVKKKKRGRPTKAMVAQRELDAKLSGSVETHAAFLSSSAQTHNLSLDSTSPTPSQILPATRKRSHASVQTGHETDEANPSSATDADIAVVTEAASNGLPNISTKRENVQGDAHVQADSATKPKKVKTAREILRKDTSNKTSSIRREILLTMLGNHDGIMCLEPESLSTFDKMFQERTGNVQCTDSSTLERTVEQMVFRKEVKRMVLLCENATKSNRIRRTIFYRYNIADNDPKVRTFMEATKLKEQSRRPVVASHRAIAIVPRPEMEVLARQRKTNHNHRMIETLNLGEEAARSGLRIRLAEKQSTDSPRTKESLYVGKIRLMTFREARNAEAAARAIAEQERKARDDNARVAGSANKCRSRFTNILPRIPTKSEPNPPEIQETAPRNDAVSVPLVTKAPIKSRKTETAAPRKAKSNISKRGDRFNERDEAHENDVSRLQTSRRRLDNYSAMEDDILIRAVSLSILFFSRSALQAKIDWDVVHHLLPRGDCKRRYTSIKSDPKHKATRTFIGSDRFAQLYNLAVMNKVITAVPRSKHSLFKSSFNLQTIVDFSRRCSTDQGRAIIELIPSDMHQLQQGYEIVSSQNVALPTTQWTDSFFLAGTANIKEDLLVENSFYEVEESEKRDLETDLQDDHVKASMKSLLLTPEADYDADKASTELQKHANKDKIEAIIATLLKENLIIGGRSAGTRLLPGRNFQLSEKFFSRFRGPVGARTLRVANDFDEMLKESFANQKSVLYSSLANDGSSAATLELAVRGLLTLGQGRKKWGSHGVIHNYAVKRIDESLLDFDIILQRNGNGEWEEGPVVGEAVSTAPCFWFDIHGHVMDGVHRWAIALVIGFILTRGRLSAAELLRCCAPVFQHHEMHRCLMDLKRSRCIEERDGLYALKDHYYRALA